MSDKKYEAKLRKIIDEGNPRYVTHNGKKIYISRKKINEIREKEKEGGIIPFLIPLFAGIGAAGAVAGGAADIATSVNNKAASEQKKPLKQQKEHDARIEAALKGNGLFLPEYEKGNGFSDGVKAFVEKTGLDVEGKKCSVLY